MQLERTAQWIRENEAHILVNLGAGSCAGIRIVCGAFSGFAQSFLSTPVELTKIRLQMDSRSNQKYKGLTNVISAIIHTEGVRQMYRGYFATLMRDSFALAAQFSTYEIAKRGLRRLRQSQESTQLELFLSGGLAGISCWVFSYPQDIIKTRLQLETNVLYRYRVYKPNFFDGGFFSCMQSIVKEDGVRGLYKGFSPCLTRAFTANAVAFMAFEKSKGMFHRD